MKGAELNINICIGTALSLGLFMAVLNIYSSWSQHHLTDLEPLLYIVLVCISFAYLMSSFAHPNKLKEITKIGFRLFDFTIIPKSSFRLEHSLRLNAYLFAGIIVFGVNKYEITHFVFTGASILLGYLTMLIYSSSKRYYIFTLIGLGGFILGFLTNLYSVSWAEVITSLPLSIFLYTTLNEKQDSKLHI